MPRRDFPKNAKDVVRVVPSLYEGHDLIDIRVYSPDRDDPDKLTPTRKGIALNVDVIPALIDALYWALGQPCSAEGAAKEREASEDMLNQVATVAHRALVKHGAAVHWDTIEKMTVPKVKGSTKWDLHFVLASRTDLFRRIDHGCYKAI